MKTTKLYTMIATYNNIDTQVYTICGDPKAFARMVRLNRNSEVVTRLEIIIQECFTLKYINEVTCCGEKYMKLK